MRIRRRWCPSSGHLFFFFFRPPAATANPRSAPYSCSLRTVCRGVRGLCFGPSGKWDRSLLRTEGNFFPGKPSPRKRSLGIDSRPPLFAWAEERHFPLNLNSPPHPADLSGLPCSSTSFTCQYFFPRFYIPAFLLDGPFRIPLRQPFL